MVAEEEGKTQDTFLGHLTSFMDRFTGDKVILLIALFLMLISVISVFSSTPRLANDTGSDRVSIMVDQLKVVAVGFVLIFSLYYFGRVEWYKKLSMFGFAVSFGILVILVLNLNLGLVRAGEINGARRILIIAGKQVHVYEFVKLFMIMYLGWALDTFKNGEFKWAGILADKFDKLAFLQKPQWQKVVYIYAPVLLTTLMVMMGSNSSALFIGIIMVLMILVGGIDARDIGIVVGVGLLGTRKAVLERPSAVLPRTMTPP